MRIKTSTATKPPRAFHEALTECESNLGVRVERWLIGLVGLQLVQSLWPPACLFGRLVGAQKLMTTPPQDIPS